MIGRQDLERPDAIERRADLEDLEWTIHRLALILEAGAWPAGLELSPQDRRELEWNLSISRQQRAELRRVRPASGLPPPGAGRAPR